MESIETTDAHKLLPTKQSPVQTGTPQSARIGAAPADSEVLDRESVLALVESLESQAAVALSGAKDDAVNYSSEEIGRLVETLLESIDAERARRKAVIESFQKLPKNVLADADKEISHHVILATALGPLIRESGEGDAFLGHASKLAQEIQDHADFSYDPNRHEDANSSMLSSIDALKKMLGASQAIPKKIEHKRVQFSPNVSAQGTVEDSFHRVKEAINRLEADESASSLVATLNKEIQSLQDKVNTLESEHDELVSLVQKGQTIMDDLCEENESLERSLTIHMAVSPLSASRQMSLSLGARSLSTTSVDIDVDGVDGLLRHRSTSEGDVLKALFEERDKAEMYEEETRVLLEQASNAKQELDALKADKDDLLHAVEGQAWLKERDELLSALEEEKDKTSTWQEEKDAMIQRLDESYKRINELKKENKAGRRNVARGKPGKGDTTMNPTDKVDALESEKKGIQAQLDQTLEKLEDLQNAVTNANWQEEMEELVEALEEERDKTAAWEEERDNLHLQIEVLIEKNECLMAENSQLEEMMHKSGWEEERERLMQALEDEKEKTSTWEEEKSGLEAELAGAQDEVKNLSTLNCELQAAVDEIEWQEEREELIAALEEAKDRFSSWQEEKEALEEESTMLKEQAEKAEGLELVVQDKDEVIEQLNSTMADLSEKNGINQDLAASLKQTLSQSMEDWPKEKLRLLERIAGMKLAVSALEEAFEDQKKGHDVCKSRIEDLEIENDKLTKELQIAKFSNELSKPVKKNVTWGGDTVLEYQLAGALSREMSTDPQLMHNLSIASNHTPTCFMDTLNQALLHSTNSDFAQTGSTTDELTQSMGLSIRTPKRDTSMWNTL
ncbi:hypothetical protein BSKO_10756 [Bryopsis sp. KO-2023]|nr:hypothetical protein BSKO_10756 [Bryopsis sp. KO-2023]